ncbi:MAG: cytoplasmic protein [Deltaproteobacteria bacterium]|nr:MAG: cytoplasmic protein [Deltaproteobacteria bacterium]
MANGEIKFEVNINNLYREESMTDLEVGAIRCLIPVKQDGTDDDSRETVFFGHSQLMSPQGMIPLQARLEASSLAEAVEKFPEAMKASMELMIENVRQRQAQQQQDRQAGDSGIIFPGR